jgi:hypothetical protein
MDFSLAIHSIFRASLLINHVGREREVGTGHLVFLTRCGTIRSRTPSQAAAGGDAGKFPEAAIDIICMGISLAPAQCMAECMLVHGWERTCAYIQAYIIAKSQVHIPVSIRRHCLPHATIMTHWKQSIKKKGCEALAWHDV